VCATGALAGALPARAQAQAPAPRDPAGSARPGQAVQGEAAPGRSRDDPEAILLVRTRGDARFALRIRAELEASAFRVVEIGPDPELDVIALAELAARQSATAAIRVQPTRAQVELWMLRSQDSAAGALETLSVPGPRPNERVLALRVTEALRARWLRLGPAGSTGSPGPAEARTEPPPLARKPAQAAAARADAPAESDSAAPDESDAARARAAPEERPEQGEPPRAQPDGDASERAARAADDEAEQEPEADEPPPVPLRVPQLWLELAPAVAFSPGGLGPALDVSASARLQLAAEWSLGALAIVPIWSERVEEQEGSARVHTLMLGGAADYHVGARPLQFSAGLGLAALLSLMSGSTELPLSEETDMVATVGPFARVALHVELGAGLHLCARALVGASIPEVGVHFVDREVAHWGRPFVVATLGIELPLLANRR
jgi:hypothetical protein